jgi:DNA-binding IclR family transcriptional regulator
MSSVDERGGIQVIARAADILRALRDAPAGLSLGQIADRVGLPRSTVQRIVGALETERLVVSNTAVPGVRLGPEIQFLARGARMSLTDVVRPFLEELSQQTGETVDLSILQRGEIVFVDQVAGTHRLRTVSSVGEHFPVRTTANGKACLSLLAPQELRDVLRAETGRELDAGLDDELARIRETGLAFDLDEHTNGISAVGCAFRDWAGEIFAISIPTPSARFKHSHSTLERALLAARDKVLRAIGAAG